MKRFKYDKDYIVLSKIDGKSMNVIDRIAKSENKNIVEIIENMIMRGLESSGYL